MLCFVSQAVITVYRKCLASETAINIDLFSRSCARVKPCNTYVNTTSHSRITSLIRNITTHQILTSLMSLTTRWPHNNKDNPLVKIAEASANFPAYFSFHSTAASTKILKSYKRVSIPSVQAFIRSRIWQAEIVWTADIDQRMRYLTWFFVWNKSVSVLKPMGCGNVHRFIHCVYTKISNCISRPLNISFVMCFLKTSWGDLCCAPSSSLCMHLKNQIRSVIAWVGRLSSRFPGVDPRFVTLFLNMRSQVGMIISYNTLD